MALDFHRRRYVCIALRVLALVLAALLLWHLAAVLSPAPPSEDYLYVYIFDVGQSDAVLLRCGERTLLVDTGTATEERALRRALAQYGIERIDYLVLTHAHEDHIGNARFLIENLSVGRVLLPSTPGTDYAYGLLLESAAQHTAVTVAATGQHFAFGGATAEVLWAGDAGESSKDADANNASVVLRVTFGEQVLLFMGDAEEETEATLLENYGTAALDCDFLKVGHHGSSTSSSAPFLMAATPTVAVISCGKQNSYGFPHAETLESLTAIGAHIFRTDLSGTLVFGTDGCEIRHIPSTVKGLSL